MHRFHGNGTGPSVYVQAGIHGNEHPGIVVAARLLEQIESFLDDVEFRGDLTIVPLCNPYALNQTIQQEILGRFDLDTNVNFNRGFPDLTSEIFSDCKVNSRHLDIDLIRASVKKSREQTPDIFGSPEELKSYLFKLALEHDLVIDLHADNCSMLHIYGPEKETPLVNKLSAAIGCELIFRGSNNPNGGFDDALNYFWSRAKAEIGLKAVSIMPAACTLELRGRYDISEDLARDDAGALIRYLHDINVIGKKASTKNPIEQGCVDDRSKLNVFSIDGIDSACAPKIGILKMHKALGEKITEGELVAEIADPLEISLDTTLKFYAKTNGVLFCHSFHGVVPVGQTIYKIIGSKQLHKEPSLALEN